MKSAMATLCQSLFKLRPNTQTKFTGVLTLRATPTSETTLMVHMPSTPAASQGLQSRCFAVMTTVTAGQEATSKSMATDSVTHSPRASSRKFL